MAYRPPGFDVDRDAERIASETGLAKDAVLDEAERILARST